MSKRNILSILFIACCFIFIAISGNKIIAHLSDADKAENKMKIGEVEVEINENFIPPKKLEPGISFTKDVKVKNLKTDAYVRVKAVFTDSDMEKYCTVDWNTNTDSNNDGIMDWIYNNEDGYYYYTKALETDEETSSLFTTVTIKEKHDEDGDGTEEDISVESMKDFDILIYSEAFQTTGKNASGEFVTFDNYEDAWKYYHRNKK